MVSPGNFHKILIRIPAAQQLGKKKRIARNIFEPLHHRLRIDLVVVRPNPNMVKASDLLNVVDVICNLGNAPARCGMHLFPIRNSLGNRFIAAETRVQILQRGRPLRLPFRILRRNKRWNKIHMHHAAIRRQQPQDIVRNAPWVRINRKRIRMRENHRSTRHIQRIAHGVRAHMRQVHEHPQPVHLLHHTLAKLRQSVVFRPIGRGVRPIDVVPVRQRHIARAQSIKITQRRRRILDHMPAFNAKKCGDPSSLVNALDVVGGACLFEVGSIGLNKPQRNIELPHRFMQRSVRLLRGRFHKHRPVLRAYPPFAQTGNVRAQRRLGLAHIKRSQIAGFGFQKSGRKIVVRIDQRSLLQERFRVLQQFRVDRRRISVSGNDTREQRMGGNRGSRHQAGLLNKTSS